MNISHFWHKELPKSKQRKIKKKEFATIKKAHKAGKYKQSHLNNDKKK